MNASSALELELPPSITNGGRGGTHGGGGTKPIVNGGGGEGGRLKIRGGNAHGGGQYVLSAFGADRT